ncbi:MAG: hypothetical protein WCL04_07120 [Verrucomicrobiota bacterium]
MKWRKIFMIGMVVVVVFAAGRSCLRFGFSPTNEQDNRNPEKLKEMVTITLEWGRLAPFPAAAKNFKIHTEGSTFTRTFKGSFDASKEVITAWLAASPGVREGELKEHFPEESTTYYLLKPQPNVAGGCSIVVSADGTQIEFAVRWS